MKTINRIIPIAMGATLILITACSKEQKDLPAASFQCPNTVGVGDTIHFQNTSEGAVTFSWDFGDGNVSTEENPSHIYTEPGVFTILLVATNENGSDEISFGILIKSWSAKASMPTPRSALCTAVIDGKIYAIGGLKNEQATLSVVEVYDPATDPWDTKTPMPTARCAIDCAVVDGKIYVFGGTATAGSSILSTVEVYDPATDTWDTKTPLPTPRSDVAAESLNGKIYIIGGSKRAGLYWEGLNTVEEYDPVTDSWTKKSNMPTRRWSLGTCVVDGQIYAIGGNYQYPYIVTAVEVYDPTTDTWSKKAPMPNARYSLATCFVNGKIFAFGGWLASGADNGDPIFDIVEAYDVSTDTWTSKPDMPSTIALLSAEVVDGKIYLIGGTSKQHTFNSLNTIYEFYP